MIVYAPARSNRLPIRMLRATNTLSVLRFRPAGSRRRAAASQLTAPDKELTLGLRCHVVGELSSFL